MRFLDVYIASLLLIISKIKLKNKKREDKLRSQTKAGGANNENIEIFLKLFCSIFFIIISLFFYICRLEMLKNIKLRYRSVFRDEIYV